MADGDYAEPQDSDQNPSSSSSTAASVHALLMLSSASPQSGDAAGKLGEKRTVPKQQKTKGSKHEGRSQPPPSVRRVAPFISKLYDITSRFPDLCGFGPHGDTIIVNDAKELERTVLAQYFRHGNYRSFVRQLNLYEFRKDWDRKLIVYRHPHFLRGKPDLLHLIERQMMPKDSEGSDKKGERSHNDGSDDDDDGGGDGEGESAPPQSWRQRGSGDGPPGVPSKPPQHPISSAAAAGGGNSFALAVGGPMESAPWYPMDGGGRNPRMPDGYGGSHGGVDLAPANIMEQLQRANMELGTLRIEFAKLVSMNHGIALTAMVLEEKNRELMSQLRAAGQPFPDGGPAQHLPSNVLAPISQPPLSSAVYGQGQGHHHLQGHLQGHPQVQLPAHLQGHLQGNMPGHLQGHLQGNMPGHLQGQLQGNIPGHGQGQLQGNMPGHGQGQLQGNMPGLGQHGLGQHGLGQHGLGQPARAGPWSEAGGGMDSSNPYSRLAKLAKDDDGGGSRFKAATSSDGNMVYYVTQCATSSYPAVASGPVLGVSLAGGAAPVEASMAGAIAGSNAGWGGGDHGIKREREASSADAVRI